MTKLPKVVIVGRTNVGKSTLFNRLSVDVKSITLNQEGVTRDIIKDVVTWQGSNFELIDTGGISLRKTQDIIEQELRSRVIDSIKEADIILFMGDGTVGMLDEDREIAQILHRLNVPVFVVVNKMDNHRSREHEYEFQQLGFKGLFPISAQHGKGIGDLLEAIVQALPVHVAEIEEKKEGCRVVILGKPNVGKSSLMNMLLKEERSIVADVPGTTREAISEKIQFYKEDVQVTDTPGIRKKRAVEEPLEKLMVKSSFKALEEADLVLLMVDAVEGFLTDQELKLAFYAFQDRYKALILLINKEDLIEDVTEETVRETMEEYEHFLKHIPIVIISCKTGKNVGKILPLVQEVCKRYTQRFPDEELAYLFKGALMKKPLMHKTNPLTIRKVKQIHTAPITIAMRVNVPEWFGESQLKFFENIMRKEYVLRGVPIRFVVSKR